MSILTSTEFWATILGAVVGGAIAFVIQLYALWESRKQREADHATQQKALGNSLLFKLARIHSNIHGIHRHFWEGLAEGRKELKDAEPWQVVLPLANPPPPVHLTPDEMGMLLALKEDEIFNSVMDIEPIHNSLIGAVQFFNSERIALGEKVAAVSVMVPEAGNRGVAPPQAFMALRPKMIGVNTLFDAILSSAKAGLGHSDKTIRGVQELLRTKLNLAYKLKIKPDVDGAGKPDEAPPA